MNSKNGADIAKLPLNIDLKVIISCCSGSQI